MEHTDGSRSPEAMYDAALTYLKLGGRNLDCAEMYLSTTHVGRAIGDSGVDRAEIWITSKLSGLPINGGNFDGPADYESVRIRTQEHLEALGVAHVELLLMHWPGPAAGPEDGLSPRPRDYPGLSPASERAIALLDDPDKLASACTWEYFDRNIDAAWKNMQRLRDEGFCRHIGVSNFNAAHLARLAENSGEAPYANEIFLDVTHQRRAFVEDMLARGILPIAYRALAFLPVVEMAAAMGDETHSALAALQASLRADSVQQVVLAWLVRRGCHVLAKSGSEARLIENMRAADLAKATAGWDGDEGEGAAGGLQEADGSETVAMCMGEDECARVWMAMAPEASLAAGK